MMYRRGIVALVVVRVVHVIQQLKKGGVAERKKVRADVVVQKNKTL